MTFPNIATPEGVGALRLDVTLDAMTRARGVHSASDANLLEMVAYSPRARARGLTRKAGPT